MVKYESMFILNSELDDENKETALGKIKGAVEKNGGEIVQLDSWGKRKLAYVIKKIYKEGEYFLMIFKGNEEVLSELEHIYKISDEVIRHLVVRLEGEG